MLSVGRSFFGNEQDAEDVAQDGMLAMLKYLERMDAGEALLHRHNEKT